MFALLTASGTARASSTGKRSLKFMATTLKVKKYNSTRSSSFENWTLLRDETLFHDSKFLQLAVRKWHLDWHMFIFSVEGLAA